MKISITVMAHPSRRKEAEELHYRLMMMPFESRWIVFDTGLGEWETGERALRRNDSKADWHVVIQDDAIISDNFYKNLVAALKNVPLRSLVSLYTGKVRPIQGRVKLAFNNATIHNKSWLSFQTLLWGVGIAIPTEDINPMLKYVSGSREVYDRKIGEYYKHLNQPVYYTAVSLVDHNDSLDSIMKHGGTIEPRVAHQFVGDRLLKFNSRVEQI